MAIMARAGGSVRDSAAGRTYHVPEMEAEWPPIPSLGLGAGEAFSISTYAGCIPKPWLAPWAAKMEREAWLKAIGLSFGGWMQDDAGWRSTLSPSLYSAEIEQSVGKPYAYATIRDSAGDGGTAVHEAVEAYVRKMLGEEPPRLELEVAFGDGLTSFIQWARAVDFKPIATEQRVYLRQERTVGRFDLCGLVRGKKAMLDVKTSGQMSLDYKLQTAAYTKGAIEAGILDGEPDAIILRLPRDRAGYDKLMNRRGEGRKGVPYEEVTVPFAQHEHYMGMFRAAQTVYHELNRKGGDE